MINRELIRLKVTQLVYSNYKNNEKTLEMAVDELESSLLKSYDLYQYLLLLIPEITDFARELYESSYDRLKNLGSDGLPNPRFVNNRLAAQIEDNKQLAKFYEETKIHHWSEAEPEMRMLFKQISESDLYKEYMDSEEDSYEADKTFWCKAYKKFIWNNEVVEDILETWSIYWNDDKYIVDSFVLKTLKRFEESNGSEQPLLAAFDSAEDWKFAKDLFENVLLNKAEYLNIVAENARNWTLERMPVMDVVVLITALAEIMTFPDMKATVTFNEYINIAKVYCSEKSVPFINGMLDNIVKKLNRSNIINK